MALNKLPSQFRGSYPTSAVASYSFYDIATGTAYKTFYPMKSYNTNAVTYTMTTESSIYSHDGWTETTANSAGSMTFDLTINTLMRLKGKALINFQFGYLGSAGTPSITFTAGLYKVVGVTETLLGTTASEQVTSSFNGTDAITFMWCTDTDIPLTIFKKNDILRLKITHTNPGASKWIRYYHDPANRNDPTFNVNSLKVSRSEINLPIKLNK